MERKQWARDREDDSDLCVCVCEHLFILLASCWFGKQIRMLFKVGNQAISMNDWSFALVYDSWNQGAESRPSLVSLGLETTHD